MVHAASAAFVLELPDATEAACTRAPKLSGYFADTTLADNLEDQLALLGSSTGNVERVFHQIGRLVEILFSGVVETAKHGTGFHLLAHFDLEDHADRRIDLVLLAAAPGPHHG